MYRERVVVTAVRHYNGLLGTTAGTGRTGARARFKRGKRTARPWLIRRHAVDSHKRRRAGGRAGVYPFARASRLPGDTPPPPPPRFIVGGGTPFTRDGLLLLGRDLFIPRTSFVYNNVVYGRHGHGAQLKLNPVRCTAKSLRGQTAEV